MQKAIDSLRDLKIAYKKYFANAKPDNPERWSHCQACFERAIEAISDEGLVATVDPLISAAVLNGHTTTVIAASNVASFEPRVEQLERHLGRALGYNESELSKLFIAARGTLQSATARHVALEAPASSQDLVDRLERIHAQIGRVFQASRDDWSRRERRYFRGQMRGHAPRELYAIGAVIANASFEEYFHVSLALSLGVAGAEAPRRRRMISAVEDLADAA